MTELAEKVDDKADVELTRINALTKRIIACAIEVHRRLGPGLLESIYESALCVEFDLRGSGTSGKLRFQSITVGK